MSRRMRQIGALAGTLIVGLVGSALGATSEERVAQINARYETEWSQIRAEGDRLAQKAPQGPEVAIGIDVDVKMTEQEIILDLPAVDMRLQRVVLHLPQVAMRTQRIVWDNPEFFMGTTKCGQYPEFHGFTIRWKDIKCDLPQVRMVRREAKLDIPEFRWDTTEFKLHLPEMRMTRQRWVLHLPEVTVRDVQTEVRKMRAGGEELERRAQQLRGRQEAEIRAAVAEDLADKRTEIAKTFDDGIASLERAIADVQRYGIDPTKVRGADGETLDLVAQLKDLRERKTAELVKLDQQITSVGT